ncbi:hypothetical protein HPP92_027524, partial [Vanilla planifolia]
WNEPLVLGLVDPHDSLSHPAGVFDTQSEPATCLDPEQFTEFLIPRWFAADSSQITRFNPFTLPDAYVASQRNKATSGNIRQLYCLQGDWKRRKVFTARPD